MGIALSDELGIIASPLEVVPAVPFADFMARLQQLLAEKEVGMILVGMPRNMDGTFGPAAEKVQAFLAKLKPVITVPIRTWDERLTSTQATRSMIEGGVRREDRKEKMDAVAAAILLQSFLDSQTV